MEAGQLEYHGWRKDDHMPLSLGSTWAGLRLIDPKALAPSPRAAAKESGEVSVQRLTEVVT